MAGKRTKIAEKAGRRVRPVKIAALVVSAIQDLRETKGSTAKKIAGYISYASRIPERLVQRQVSSAMLLLEDIFFAVGNLTATITQFVVFTARACTRLCAIFAILQLIECYKHLNNNAQHPRDAVDSSKKR